MGIILAIIIFGFIVIFHEFGHFIVAKKSGIQVFDFSVGFGPSLVHWQRGETTYNIRPIPLGGYCAMGEDDAVGEKGNFNEKPVWVRMLVILAGPMFNLILAFLLSVILVSVTGYDKPVIGKVVESSPAAAAGIQSGDTILKMNGQHIHVWREITLHNAMYPGETVKVVYERDGKRHEATVTPVKSAEGRYMMGVSASDPYYTKANVFTAIQYGFYETQFSVRSTIDGLKMLIYRKIGIKQLSGPVGIGSFVNNSYKQSRGYGARAVFVTMLSIALLISANLGVMNLLPIPALDGGRLLFLIIEAIRRKRIPPEKEGMVHLAGMAALLLLMAVVMYNDITKIIAGS